MFTYRMFLSFAFTQIPELSTNNSPFKSSDPIKNLRKRGRVSIASEIWSLSFGDFGPGLTGRHTKNEPVSAESHVVAEKVFGSEVSLVAHLAGPVPLTRGPGARSKRARLTSPELTRVDRAPCSPTPSGAFSLRRPRARRPSLHPLRALFFTPRAFPNVSRSDGGASPSRGARRRPAERSGLTPPGPQIPP